MKVGQNKMLMVLFEAGTELGGAGFVLRSSDAVVQLIGGKLLQVAVGPMNLWPSRKVSKLSFNWV